MKSFKDNFSKAKDWTDNNRNLALGAAAATGVVALTGLLALIPAWRAKRGKDGRHRQNKYQERIMKRALDDPDFVPELEDQELLQFLARYVDELYDD